MAETGHTSLKVPRDNNRYLCIPTANVAPQLLSENASRLATSKLPEWLSSLRAVAREQTLRAAAEYVSRYSDQSFTADSNATLIVGGHQPELFHPGVWFKNFLLWELGQSNNATSLHVIVDHDLARTDVLRVPYASASSEQQPARTTTETNRSSLLRSENVRLPFRTVGVPLPWHLTSLASDHPIGVNAIEPLDDNGVRSSIESRDEIGNSNGWLLAEQQIRTMLQSVGVDSPIASDAFPKIAANLQRGLNLSNAISRVRHEIELNHGVRNLEVPMSLLCEQSAFASFVYHLFSNAEQFASIYNSCRSEYRTARKIQNPTQPVLKLESFEDWLELPLWLYSSSRPIRKRLWFRKRDNAFEVAQHPLDDPTGIRITLPKERDAFLTQWAQLASQAVAIRPRALMTTMYLRCIVSDLFVHGIGGGIYDELTDAIIREFIQIEPPHFLICSASLHLPMSGTSLPNRDELVGKESKLEYQLQLIRSRPERFVSPEDAKARQLLEQHATLLQSIPERGQKKHWHDEITSIKRHLSELVHDQRIAIEEFHRGLAVQFQQATVANSREYSFVLFQQNDLVGRLLQMASQASRAII